jgi:hypothetical protein
VEQRAAVGVAPVVLTGRLADRGDLRADPGGGEHPRDLVVVVHRPRARVGLGPPFGHTDPVPVLGQHDRQHLADRPVPDNQDVAVDAS